MPFPWQTSGALQGTVPNQMSAFTPQNAQGLSTPWGTATFNLSRMASSDPVANIMRDVGNPMGGFNASFGFKPAQQQGAPQLKNQMLGMNAQMGYNPLTSTPSGKPDTSTKALAEGGPIDTTTQALATMGTTPNMQQLQPFSLRTRMMSQPQQPFMSPLSFF